VTKHQLSTALAGITALALSVLANSPAFAQLGVTYGPYLPLPINLLSPPRMVLREEDLKAVLDATPKEDVVPVVGDLGGPVEYNFDPNPFYKPPLMRTPDTTNPPEEPKDKAKAERQELKSEQPKSLQSLQEPSKQEPLKRAGDPGAKEGYKAAETKASNQSMIQKSETEVHARSMAAVKGGSLDVTARKVGAAAALKPVPMQAGEVERSAPKVAALAAPVAKTTSFAMARPLTASTLSLSTRAAALTVMRK
jgi:hypothetical protein